MPPRDEKLRTKSIYRFKYVQDLLHTSDYQKQNRLFLLYSVLLTAGLITGGILTDALFSNLDNHQATVQMSQGVEALELCDVAGIKPSAASKASAAAKAGEKKKKEEPKKEEPKKEEPKKEEPKKEEPKPEEPKKEEPKKEEPKKEEPKKEEPKKEEPKKEEPKKEEPKKEEPKKEEPKKEEPKKEEPKKEEPKKEEPKKEEPKKEEPKKEEPKKEELKPEEPPKIVEKTEPEKSGTGAKADSVASKASTASSGRNATKRQRGVKDPAQIRANSTPVYPQVSREKGEEGKVVCATWIDSSGKATKVEVVKSSGFPPLDQSAMAYLQQATYTPARNFLGEDTASKRNFTINFKLEN